MRRPAESTQARQPAALYCASLSPPRADPARRAWNHPRPVSCSVSAGLWARAPPQALPLCGLQGPHSRGGRDTRSLLRVPLPVPSEAARYAGAGDSTVEGGGGGRLRSIGRPGDCRGCARHRWRVHAAQRQPRRGLLRVGRDCYSYREKLSAPMPGELTPDVSIRESGNNFTSSYLVILWSTRV
ncbi:unnamed protein product [Bubo scandiacus]